MTTPTNTPDPVLPPLPKPPVKMQQPYSEMALIDYGRACYEKARADERRKALEEAAAVCEAYEKQVSEACRDNRAQHFMGAMVGASACADRIRALIATGLRRCIA